MQSNRIHILDDIVAQRIAAGEVIERPESIVRELLDNAIDAGAGSIDVYITDGGITEIRVIDDGTGMSAEDLQKCCKPHATSKITRIDDLYNLHTLGFRGEALYSIAACSRLTITSRFQGDCNTLTVTDGIEQQVTSGGNTPGTTVTARDIFYAIPGRRNFLKRPQAESAACRKTFLNKALPFHEISFRFFSNGQLKLHLPAADPVQRVIQAFPDFLQDVFVGHPESTSGNFSIQAICSTPDIHRTDRSYLQVYVNRRRIQEYSLVQAITYGYNYHLPGGSFPYCFLFIEDDPELVDFNIHPAKREAKIRNITEIHHETVQMLKKWLDDVSRKQASAAQRKAIPDQAAIPFEEIDRPKPAPSDGELRNSGELREQRQRYSGSPSRQQSPSPASSTLDEKRTALRELLSSAAPEDAAEEVQPAGRDFIYKGQIFNLFLLAERGEELIIIDQHAAHERIIYEELRGSPVIQHLLIPFVFEPDPDIDRFLATCTGIYRDLGIELKQKGDGVWEMHSIPAVCSTIQHDVIDFIMKTAGNRDEIEKKLYAMISCRAAVKDGDSLDRVTAEQLIAEALQLPVARCPHGRPVWKRITRQQLFRDVGRLV